MKKVIETLDYTDWAEELLGEEPDLSSVETTIKEQMENQRSTQQIGRWVVAGRVLGIAAKNLLPPTKLLVQAAAARHWAQRMEKEKEVVITEEGKEINVRSYVGPVGSDEDGAGKPWVNFYDPAAIELAKSYLLNGVPGHIRSRLNIIAAAGGDVARVAADLKHIIDEMVAALT